MRGTGVAVPQTVPLGHLAPSHRNQPCPRKRGSARMDLPSPATRGTNMEDLLNQNLDLLSQKLNQLDQNQLHLLKTSIKRELDQAEPGEILDFSEDSKSPIETKPTTLPNPLAPSTSLPNPLAPSKPLIRVAFPPQISLPNPISLPRPLPSSTSPSTSTSTQPPSKKKKMRPGKRERMAMKLAVDVNDQVTLDLPEEFRPKSPENETSLEKFERRLRGFQDLSEAQRNNPLTIVIVHRRYPDEVLTPEHLGNLRGAVIGEVNKTPKNQWPRFSECLIRGGAVIVIAADKASRNWFTSRLWTLVPRVGADVEVGGTELLQVRFTRLAVWVPGPRLEPEEVLRRLETYNPELKTTWWKIYNSPEGTNEGEEGQTMFLGIPETSMKALEALKFRAFYDLGRISFLVEGPERQNPDPIWEELKD